VHIPDGYLAPAISLALAVPTVPVWGLATRKVQKVLNNRTVPLLAIFSALSFTVMMFNIPVPGGTTAHGVGGTLIAVVLGPWAACIAVSTALILQALFFGDGGILAIFANCLNMGVLLPFTGYAVYRLFAAGAPILSTRRAVAAAIGAYVGITVSALAVGIELGIEPLLFSSNGHALYSPYGLAESIPAMLLAHALGASIVEALLTGLGVAYLQRRHPEYLTSLKGIFAPEAGAEGVAGRRPLWQLVAATAAACVAVLAAVGLVEGGGNPGRMFGADWGAVDWPSVATMLLITAVIGLALVPLVYFAAPRRVRRIAVAFVTIAVLAPLGLVAPGLAYGEGSARDVNAAFGYVPSGLRDLSGLFGAPLSGYNLPLPFFDGANAPLWHAAIGYEISGILGILLVGGAVYALARLLRRSGAAEPSTAGVDA
jgi:cobalt/nickel transport system permease protein